jgi:hypothetical protein
MLRRPADVIARSAIVLIVAISGISSPGQADEAAPAADINAANNPLTPLVTLNLQDYFDPSLSGLHGRTGNQFLFRGLVPQQIGGLPQLTRFTIPTNTAPQLPFGAETAVGDVTLTDYFVMSGPIAFAGGPVLVIPSETDLSVHRWQAGASGAMVAPQSWGIVGGLVTYQHSFAGALGFATVSTLTFQPVITYNLPDDFYLRSTAIWSFDLVHNVSSVPIGLGVGRVMKIGEDVTVNAFIEPQYSIARNGVSAPIWQIFGGVNFQFAMR